MSARANADRSSPVDDEGPGDEHPAAAARADPLAVQRDSPIDRLATAWSDLERASTSPTQHFIWSSACAGAFHGAGDIQPTMVGNERGCTAIAPLIRTHEGVARLELLGVNELFEPMDFLYSGPRALAALATRLAHQPLPLRLLRLPADSPTIAALQQAFKGRGLIRVAPISPCPTITLGRALDPALDPGWAEPEQRFNSGRRSDFRRALRHAQQLGEVTFEILSPPPDRVGCLLDEALGVEAMSWKGDEGSALAHDPLRERFFRRYAHAASAQGILRLVFMRIDGRAVGMQIALECNQRFWLLKIGYDERVSRCSPGTLLMLHSVKYAATRGLESYELLGGAAPWTATWTTTLRSCVVLRAYPFTGPGLAALVVDTTRWVQQRARRRLERIHETPPA
jgi:CelD/BcsL family acetyltransferase involved in cellulose biosynthesis